MLSHNCSLFDKWQVLLAHHIKVQKKHLHVIYWGVSLNKGTYLHVKYLASTCLTKNECSLNGFLAQFKATEYLSLSFLV